MSTQRRTPPMEREPGSFVDSSDESRILRPSELAEVPAIASLGLPRLRLLWEQRAFLARVAVWGAAAALVLALLIPKRFESRTLLMPPEQSNLGLASLMAMTRSADSLGALAGDLLGMKTSGALFMGILSSRTVEERIVTQFDLRSVYHVSRMEQARKVLEANTFMTEDRKSGILGITVSDGDPKRAAAIGQAYVDELDRLVAELNTSTAHRERVFLEERLKTIKQDLDSAAHDFSEFASKNAALDIKEQGKATMEAAAVLEGELIAAQSEREGLRQIYSDENVRVRALSAKIAELQKSLDQIGGGTADAATPGKPGTAGNSDTAYPSLRKLPLLGVTYAELFRRTKVEETLYDVLTQQYEFAKVQEAKETPSVRILDPPSVPEKKSFPPRLLIVVLGTFLSLIFGAAWLLAGAVWRETDSQNPAKAFLRDIYSGVKTDVRGVTRNGSRLGHLRERIVKFKSRS
jgi:capsule polysaccharide export protein KpsE/RkpR